MTIVKDYPDNNRRKELRESMSLRPANIAEADYLEGYLTTSIEQIGQQIDSWIEGEHEGSEEWVGRAKWSRSALKRRVIRTRESRIRLLREQGGHEDLVSLHDQAAELTLTVQELTRRLREKTNEAASLRKSRDIRVAKAQRRGDRLYAEKVALKKFIKDDFPDALPRLHELISETTDAFDAAQTEGEDLEETSGQEEAPLSLSI